MPLTNAQTTDFFEDANNMAIEHNMTTKPQGTGIDDVDDFEMFDEYFLKQLPDNLKFPVVHIDVGGGIVAT